MGFFCVFYFLFVFMWTIFKVFVEFVTILLLLLLLFFFLWFAFLTVRHLGILAPRPGSELVLPAMEGEASTTRMPGKSQVEDAFEKSTDVGWE